MEFIATFGYDHRDPDTGERLGGCFVRVPADDAEHARQKMLYRHGSAWAFLYPSEEGAGVERFGLREAPWREAVSITPVAGTTIPFLADPAPLVGDVVLIGQIGGSPLRVKVDKVVRHPNGSNVISGRIVKADDDA